MKKKEEREIFDKMEAENKRKNDARVAEDERIRDIGDRKKEAARLKKQLSDKIEHPVETGPFLVKK